eukprot:scaffold121953_cov20-Prasinocladus_malaysianus.AAC.1
MVDHHMCAWPRGRSQSSFVLIEKRRLYSDCERHLHITSAESMLGRQIMACIATKWLTDWQAVGKPSPVSFI